MPNLIPNPLHPAMVHMPIALMLLLPIFAVGSLLAIRRGVRPIRAWGLTTALTGLLVASAGVAVLTGESQADPVERAVGEQLVDTHEEAGEAFLVLSGVVFAIATAGLTSGLPGRVARAISAAAMLGLVIIGWRVGHSGGAIVYQHGAIVPAVVGAAAGSSTRTAVPSGRDAVDQ